MTTNYHRTKEWLNLSLSNIDRVIRNYEFEDYADCVFRIQLSVEQLQKSLIFLFGLQFRKIHNVSEILEKVQMNQQIQMDHDKVNKVNEISNLAKIIESEETATRYGIIKDDMLITPEERYDKEKTIKFLNILLKIINNFTYLMESLPDLENEISKLRISSEKIKKMIKYR